MEVGGGGLAENEHKDIVIVGVVGDAMHAMGPFIAQGGAASLEDAVVFARCFADIGIRNSGLMTMLPDYI
ncbi:hypothetical protein C3L33_13146, partial [Rhododendron williamsianum]